MYLIFSYFEFCLFYIKKKKKKHDKLRLGEHKTSQAIYRIIAGLYPT